MDKLIAFTGAVSFPFVLFVAALLAAPVIAYAISRTTKLAPENSDKSHTETMTRLETAHRETMAKIQAENPKVIEGVPRIGKTAASDN